MGKKDTCEKEYIAGNEVFADIVNVMIFHGRQVVYPEDLQEVDSTEVYTEFTDPGASSWDCPTGPKATVRRSVLAVMR